MNLQSLRAPFLWVTSPLLITPSPTDLAPRHAQGDGVLGGARAAETGLGRLPVFAGALGGATLPGITMTVLRSVAPSSGMTDAARREHLYFERLVGGQLMGCVAAGAALGHAVAQARQRGSTLLGPDPLENIMGAAVGGCLMGIAACTVGMMAGMLACDGEAVQPVSPYVVGFVTCAGVGALFWRTATCLLGESPHNGAPSAHPQA